MLSKKNMNILIALYLLSSVSIYLSFVQEYKYVGFFSVSLVFLFLFFKNGMLINKNNAKIYFLFLFSSVFVLLNNFSINGFYYIFVFIVNMIVMEFLYKNKLSVSFSFIIIIFLLIVSSVPIYDSYSHGLMSIFGNANTLSIVLCLPFFLLLNIKEKISFPLYSILFLYIIVLMIMTNSRSQYLFLMIFISLSLVSKVVSVARLKKIGLFGVFFVSIMYVLLMYGELNNYLSALIGWSEKGINLSGRDDLFRTVVLAINENPFGIGFGESNSYIYSVLGKGLSPHNSFLKILLEGGWLFFFVFLIVLFLLIKGMSKAYNIIFFFSYVTKLLFESMIPFTPSLISMLFVLPYFLDEMNSTRYNKN